MRTLSSADLASLDRLLQQPDGSKLSNEQAVEMYGYRAVWVAALNQEVSKILRQRRLHGYPPRVFLSYRWEGPEHRQWVERVGNAFKDAGYEILFDQYDCHVKSHMDVPAYVARLADCQMVVMIVTPDYLGSETWVRDEINIAVALFNQGLTRNIALVKSDVEPGLVFKLGCRPEDLVDLTNVADPYEAVRQRFQYRGAVYNAKQQAQLKRLIDAVEQLVDDEEYGAAAEQLMAYPEFQGSIEFNAFGALLYAKVGQKNNALITARNVLKAPRVDAAARLRLAETFRECQQYREALATLLPIRGRNREAPLASYLFGLILDDMGAYEAARNHLVNCSRKIPPTQTLYNDLGVVYRNNRQYDEAEACFRQALELQPKSVLTLANLAALLANQNRLAEADEFARRGYQLTPQFERLIDIVQQIPPPQFRRTSKPGEVKIACEECRSSFIIDIQRELLCGGCGCVYEGKFEGKLDCPCCGNDAVVPTQILAMDIDIPMTVVCPVCTQGALIRTGRNEPSDPSKRRRLRESRTEAGELAAMLDEEIAQPDIRLWMREQGIDPEGKLG